MAEWIEVPFELVVYCIRRGIRFDAAVNELLWPLIRTGVTDWLVRLVSKQGAVPDGMERQLASEPPKIVWTGKCLRFARGFSSTCAVD